MVACCFWCFLFHSHFSPESGLHLPSLLPLQPNTRPHVHTSPQYLHAKPAHTVGEARPAMFLGHTQLRRLCCMLSALTQEELERRREEMMADAESHSRQREQRLRRLEQDHRREEEESSTTHSQDFLQYVHCCVCVWTECMVLCADRCEYSLWLLLALCRRGSSAALGQCSVLMLPWTGISCTNRNTAGGGPIPCISICYYENIQTDNKMG